ncbi:MAG: hypothetical protein E6Q59_01760 [Nitrosomonas sp.]|nr:MAG: hypothetical protein E6Q59_01760 [Nitrosomonas sp.]
MKRTLPGKSEQQVSQVRAAAGELGASRTHNLEDNRPSTIAQRQLIENIRSGPKASAQRRMAQLFHDSARRSDQRLLKPIFESNVKASTHSIGALLQRADVKGAKAGQLKNDGWNFRKTALSANVVQNNATTPIQRKIFFMDSAEELKIPKKKEESQKQKKVLDQLWKNEFTQNQLTYHKEHFVLETEFKKAVTDALSGDSHTLLVKGEDNLLNPNNFILSATSQLGPNPANFKVKPPTPGSIGVRDLNAKFAFKYVPENKDEKKPGYVANIASYYAEGGVKKIAKKYFDEAISGSNDSKANKLAITIGLNSFSPVIQEDYDTRKNAVENAVDGLEIPAYPINFRGFGFLWEPNWSFKDEKVNIQKLRNVLTYASDAGNRKEKFKEVQKTLSENYPYGVFRETVMGSTHTQDLVDLLKPYNNPVYIHSGDGDAVGLKVTHDEDTGISDKGVLDKFTEHLENKGTGAQIVIGGYNLYNLNQTLLLTEIVKADSRFDNYLNGGKIDKQKPSPKLEDYKEEHQVFLKQKIAQIEHNSQVGNRYDRIIRDAISDIYPKMLYPTEPNMLIKAYDTEDDTDFFNTSLFGNKKLKNQGSLWGVGASEGRIFKENLEKEYEETGGDGKGFVDWAQGASLPTDPRGFARHLLVSGYEKFPGQKADWPPFAKYESGKENTDIPLLDATVQQAQSYTSAYRLSELYAQASVPSGLSKPESRKKIDEIKGNARIAFNTVEAVVKKMMDGSANLSFLQQEADRTTGSEKHDQIAKRIRQELLAKYKFYNGIE